ncbi:MAG TPA: hypothetical protein G4O06_08310 [Dehalococcoidia bacterium]|nr:hypothetical protein [Dehalococcoidia bacterium]
MKCKICEQDNPEEARFCANCGAKLVARVDPTLVVAVPSPPLTAPEVVVECMGFWIRFAASIIDYVAIAVIFFVLTPFAYGPGSPSVIFLAWLYHWLFTGLKGQTLGKMVVGIKVINAQGNRPGLGYAALREVPGKLISAIVLCLGFLWIAVDRQKQGWHDKIANTYVVKVKPRREGEKGL